MALSQEQIRRLKRGQALRVVKEQGQGDNHLIAKALVLGRGTAGCSLKVIEILSKGEAHPATVGRVLTGTFAELELIV